MSMQRYAVDYQQDRRLFRASSQRLGNAILLAAVCVAPFLMPAYFAGEITFIFIMGIASIGLMILTGFTGQVSLGHSANQDDHRGQRQPAGPGGTSGREALEARQRVRAGGALRHGAECGHDQGGGAFDGLPGDRLGHASPREVPARATTFLWRRPMQTHGPCGSSTAPTRYIATPSPNSNWPSTADAPPASGVPFEPFGGMSAQPQRSLELYSTKLNRSLPLPREAGQVRPIGHIWSEDCMRL